jgi:putative endonuclease
MAEHNEIGKLGEELAAVYLENNGYDIIKRNFKFRNNEIDIIVMDENDVLHFVEVKTLQGSEYPEASVKTKKFREICKAADAYLFKHPEYKKIQFDILAINLHDGDATYFFIEDVYL